MSQLDEIKARVEKAEEARRKYGDSEDETQDAALSVRAAFIAEQSSYDVPKLLAALEAVLSLRDTMRREEGDWANPEAHFARLITEAIKEALA